MVRSAKASAAWVVRLNPISFAVLLRVSPAAKKLGPIGGFKFCKSLQGVGHGFAQPPLTSVIATAVPPSLFGTASGVSRLASQIGSSLGLSLFGALLSVPADDLGLPMIFVIGMAISFLGLVPAFFIQSSRKRYS